MKVEEDSKQPVDITPELAIIRGVCVYAIRPNFVYWQGSKIVLVRSYLRVSQAAGQVNILIFLLKIKFSPCMPINFVMQGKYLFSDISRPDWLIHVM